MTTVLDSVVCMVDDPHPVDHVPLDKFVQFLPQVLVLNGLSPKVRQPLASHRDGYSVIPRFTY